MFITNINTINYNPPASTSEPPDKPSYNYTNMSVKEIYCLYESQKSDKPVITTEIIDII